MLRLTLMLSAAIYAGLVIVSERVPDEPAIVGQAVLAVDVSRPAMPGRSDMLVTEDGRSLAIAAVIDPPRTIDPEVVTLISTRSAEAVTVSASAGLPDLPLVEVTGNHVNLRAGPSTDTAVLGALVRGERAELIGADGNGWVLIRAVSTGIEGYMADRFVSVVN
jgi:hypothetical protein